jgi:hypothetical protein
MLRSQALEYGRNRFAPAEAITFNTDHFYATSDSSFAGKPISLREILQTLADVELFSCAQ